MDNIKDFSDTLLYFVPAVLVIGAMFLLVKKFLDRDFALRAMDAKRSMQKDSVPIRLQALERLVLFLERISPNNLLVRLHRGGVSAAQLHSDLLATIRAEYEHNLSQQLYISATAWEAVKDSKEDMLRIINHSLESVGANGTGMQLSAKIFDLVLKEGNIPTQKAIDILKNEAKHLLG